MTDQDHRKPQPILQVPQQLESLRLNNHVERSPRFVTYQHRWIGRKSHSNQSSLPHSSTELMGIIVRSRRLNPDRLKKLSDPFLNIRTCHSFLVYLYGLSYLLTYFVDRI